MSSFAQDDPVVVVGAGILGASAAWHLARAGARRVTLVDAGTPDTGTTPAGAGFVAAFAADTNRRFHANTIALETYGVDFYRGLHEAGHEIEFAANGNIVLALTADGLERLRTGLLEHPGRLPGTRSLAPEEIATLTRGAIDQACIAGGVLMSEGIQITTGQAVEALLADLHEAGASVHHETVVEGLDTSGGQLSGVRTSRGVIPASSVVIACGAWTNQVLKDLDFQIPIVPVVATRFVTADVGISPQMPTVQCPELQLWIRELHGAYSWGVGAAYRRVSGIEDLFAGDPSGRPHSPSLIRKQLESQDAIADVFPALRDQPPEHIIQGIPAYSVDGDLFIGQVPTCPGVWVIGGDNESGVTHGPGMGRMVSDLMLGQPPLVDPAPFRLDRIDPADFPDEASIIQRMSGDRVSAQLQ